MQKLDKIKVGTVPEQQVEVDPRSKTTADQSLLTTLAQENLKCQCRGQGTECWLKRKETQRRTNGLVQSSKNSFASWK
jgi:hypothetical protein